MKKFLSVVLALTMIVSMFTTASAATISELFNGKWGTTNLVYGDVMLNLAISAKKSGTSDAYSSASLNLVDSALSSGIGVDYKATLDMTDVQTLVANLLAEDFIDITVENDATAKQELYDGAVTTNIRVKVTYPTGAADNTILSTAGNIDNAAYIEDGIRTFASEGGNTTATIKYKQANNSITVGTLANISTRGTLFDDINFTLENAIAYNPPGTYTVSVELEGETTFSFGSGATATVNYKTIPASHTVSASTPTATGGGGGSATSYSIQFNTNGGNLLNHINVGYGNTIANLPVPQRYGYVFAGWYTDEALTTPFDPATIIKKAYTLYAKWTEDHECRGIEEDNCPCLDFIDLDPTLWYHRGVDYVLNNGMMIGVEATEFAPDEAVTRAMLVTVLWRAEGKPGARGSSFEDLEDGEYYVHAVDWAAANGIVMGYSDTEFGPHDAITREQFAAIIYRYATKKGYDVSVGENTNILSYEDYDSISEYAIPSLQYAVGSGLIKGRTETTLNPLDNTTRAEMATILYRFFTENK